MAEPDGKLLKNKLLYKNMTGPHAGRAGTCVYCGAIAIDTCQFCGALVCKMHFHAATGACVACLKGKSLESADD